MNRTHRSLIWLAAFLVAGHSTSRAQTSDRDAMLAAVQEVFDALRTKDTMLLKEAFDTTGRLVGVSNRGGSPSVSLTTPSQFGAAFSRSPADQVWNERIYDPDVKIDGTV